MEFNYEFVAQILTTVIVCFLVFFPLGYALAKRKLRELINCLKTVLDFLEDVEKSLDDNKVTVNEVKEMISDLKTTLKECKKLIK